MHRSWILFFLPLLQQICTVFGKDSNCGDRCLKYELTDFGPHSKLTNNTINTISIPSNVGECLQMCVMDCRCRSINFAAPLCELNLEDKDTQPQSLISSPDFSYYSIKIANGGKADGCPCENWCCLSNPCKNGGTCTEICDDERSQIQCSCPSGWIGNLCQRRPQSCIDYFRYNRNILSGKYLLYDRSGVPFTVHCLFNKSMGWAWTLVMSYKIDNNDNYHHKDITLDDPRKQDSPNWDDYRLSLTNMQDLKDRSTDWRATCSFNIYGFDGRDYVQTRFTNYDILQPANSAGKCHTFDYLNLKGKDCPSNETTFVIQGDYSSYMFRISPQMAKQKGCTYSIPNPSHLYPQIFGYYKMEGRVPDIRCTESSNSTTNFWFGSRFP